MKVAAGTVLDRPWGQTLGTVGMRRLTGQVTVRADDGKTYDIGFVEGNVAASVSPLPNDSVTRVALTNHFLSPMQVGDITRRLATDKSRDEVEIVADASRLSPEQIMTLRRRLLIQRAARTFAVDRAQFEIDDTLMLPTVSNFSVPLVLVIFHGVRMNLSEQRLIEDMRELGTSFVMRPAVTDDEIAQLEMDGDITEVISRLRDGTTLPELEAAHREIEPRTLQAMLYAMICCSMVDAAGGQRIDRTVPPAPRTSTGAVSASQSGLRIKTDQPLTTRQRSTMAPANMPRTQGTTPPATATGSQPFPARTIETTNVTPRISITMPPVNQPATKPPTNPPANAPRVSTTPLNTPRITNTPPLGTRPITTPPLRSTTSPPMTRGVGTPRMATPTSTPFDEEALEHSTARVVNADEFLREMSTGSNEFKREPSTASINPLNEFKREVSTSGGNPLNEFKREVTTNRGITVASRTITAPRTITERDRAAREIEAMIALRLSKLEQGADYFAMLGVPFEAPIDVVRHAYVETSRKLHPETLAQLGLQNESKSAQRVLAQINAAFQCLSDPQKRREYVSAIRRGEATPIAPRARTGDLDKNELAAEAFVKGSSALKREDIPTAVEELGRACMLAPSNHEYMAMLAWAQFCAASDKQKIYPDTRKQLQVAINRLENSVLARFYLGRVERMLGHDREALNHFELVLMEEPGHKEAQSEVRVLQQRLAKGTKPKR